jgi:hypothetical protein
MPLVDRGTTQSSWPTTSVGAPTQDKSQKTQQQNNQNISIYFYNNFVFEKSKDDSYVVYDMRSCMV